MAGYILVISKQITVHPAVILNMVSLVLILLQHVFLQSYYSFMYLYSLPEQNFSEFAASTKIACLNLTVQITIEQQILPSVSSSCHDVEVRHIQSALPSLINVHPNRCFRKLLHYPLHAQEEKGVFLRITSTSLQVMLVPNKSLCNIFIFTSYETS